MRYLPTQASDAAPFDEANRPPLELLPVALAAKLTERDGIVTQLAAARQAVSALAGDAAVETARATDAAAATAAALAGEAIPDPAAVPALEDDRAAAAHALKAQEAALAAVTAECAALATQAHLDGAEDVAAARALIRADVTAQAALLADAVEGAVATNAVADWLAHGVHDTAPMTWPTDVLDLSAHKLHRDNTAPVDARDVILSAALAALDE